MKIKLTKFFALAVGIFAFHALASDVASNWKIEGDYLIEVLDEGDTATAWKFLIQSAGADSVQLRSDASNVVGSHTVLDFSALDGSEGSVCKLTIIAQNLFLSNTTITGVKFPSTLIKIEPNAFNSCTSLTGDLNLPNVTEISNSAFNGTKITGKLDFPYLTTLGNNAFQNVKTITEVNLPNVTTIPDNAFNGCSGLTRVTLPAVTFFGVNVFNGCSSLTSLDFPYIITLRANAFSLCSSLNSLSIPQVAEIVGGSVFGSCIELKSVFMPALTNVCYQGFRGYTGVVKLPHCLQDLDSDLYYNNQHLGHLLIHRDSPFAATGIRTKDDGSMTLYGPEDNPDSQNGKVSVTLYGGKVVKGGIDWIYDNAVWDATTTNYVIQSSNVTIVATASTLSSDVMIPKKLSIEESFTNDDGETETRTVNATVTAIEACAFKDNEELIGKTVTVPATVTRIDVAAFPKGCFIKVKNSSHAQDLVDMLNDEYGIDEETAKPYASIDFGGGLKIIVR